MVVTVAQAERQRRAALVAKEASRGPEAQPGQAARVVKLVPAVRPVAVAALAA